MVLGDADNDRIKGAGCLMEVKRIGTVISGRLKGGCLIGVRL